jgi:hypothetical protein
MAIIFFFGILHSASNVTYVSVSSHSVSQRLASSPMLAKTYIGSTARNTWQRDGIFRSYFLIRGVSITSVFKIYMVNLKADIYYKDVARFSYYCLTSVAIPLHRAP